MMCVVAAAGQCGDAGDDSAANVSLQQQQQHKRHRLHIAMIVEHQPLLLLRGWSGTCSAISQSCATVT